jgi:hypothetical protein
LMLVENPTQYVLFHAFFLAGIIQAITEARIRDNVPADKGAPFEKVRNSILKGTLDLMDEQRAISRKRAKR